MTTTSDHIETALDQLRLAFEASETTDEGPLFFLAAAQVHATLALTAAVRELVTVQSLVPYTPY